jgi:hypothetical protein
MLLSTPLDLEELGRALAQFEISFVMHDDPLRKERQELVSSGVMKHEVT